MTRFCRECGSEIEEGAGFCYACGAGAEGAIDTEDESTFSSASDFRGASPAASRALSGRELAAMALACVAGAGNVFGLGHLLLRRYSRGAMYLLISAVVLYLRWGTGGLSAAALLGIEAVGFAIYMVQAFEVLRLALSGAWRNGPAEGRKGGRRTAEDWTEKYRPRTLGGIVGNPGAASQMRQWALSWQDGAPEKRALVLIGSPGIGKTSSALALAAEMGWGVVEMNASDQRTGQAIEAVASRASNSSAFTLDGGFRSAKDGGRTLIVLDEADSLYGNADRGAMPAINKLIRETGQPLVLICNDFYELSRKSSTVKTGTLQITFRKPAPAAVAKVLRTIAAGEGVAADEEAIAKVAENARGDLRAAVRDFESLAQDGRVEASEASELSGRAERKSLYDLMDAVFRKRDPALASKTMFEADEDPETISLWVDENMPYECRGAGDLVRCSQRLARADVFLGRARSSRQFGMWSYAGQMMTLGVMESLKGQPSRDRIRFPTYLSKMSRSRSVRAVRKSLALKVGAHVHASEDAVCADVLPYLSIFASMDRGARAFLVRDVGLEAEELAFLLGKKTDSKDVRQAFADAFPEPEEKPAAKPAKRVAPPPAPKAEEPDVPDGGGASPEPPPESDERPAPPRGQKSLFDFRGDRMPMDQGYRETLLRQHYRLYGDHAAVKLCGWMKQALLHGRRCYKQDFYGIMTHRCLQMTPSINECTHMCPFCWRVEGHDYEVREWAEPKEMLDALIAYQRELLLGFKGDPRCTAEMWREAWEPDQVAISLAGEPTEYPYLSEFIGECRSRGMTTFLVTNGTLPERIEALRNLPSELYVTVAAPDEETYRRTCAPKIPDGWERLNRTLSLLPGLRTRTVVRHTLVQEYNMKDPEGYARLDAAAEPDFVEAKGFVFVGGARQRLTVEQMPSHESVRAFGEAIASRVGMEVLKERSDSRVVLLGDPSVETDIRKALEEGGGVPRSPRIDRLLARTSDAARGEPAEPHGEPGRRSSA